MNANLNGIYVLCTIANTQTQKQIYQALAQCAAVNEKCDFNLQKLPVFIYTQVQQILIEIVCLTESDQFELCNSEECEELYET